MQFFECVQSDDLGPGDVAHSRGNSFSDSGLEEEGVSEKSFFDHAAPLFYSCVVLLAAHLLLLVIIQ